MAEERPHPLFPEPPKPGTPGVLLGMGHWGGHRNPAKEPGTLQSPEPHDEVQKSSLGVRGTPHCRLPFQESRYH